MFFACFTHNAEEEKFDDEMSEVVPENVEFELVLNGLNGLDPWLVVSIKTQARAVQSSQIVANSCKNDAKLLSFCKKRGCW